MLRFFPAGTAEARRAIADEGDGGPRWDDDAFSLIFVPLSSDETV